MVTRSKEPFAAEVESIICFVAVPEAGWNPGGAVVAALLHLEHLRLLAVGVDGKSELDAAVDAGDEKFVGAEGCDDGAAFVQAGGAGGGGDGRGGRIVGGRERRR